MNFRTLFNYDVIYRNDSYLSPNITHLSWNKLSEKNKVSDVIEIAVQSIPTYTTDVAEILLVTKIAQNGKSSNVPSKKLTYRKYHEYLVNAVFIKLNIQNLQYLTTKTCVENFWKISVF